MKDLKDLKVGDKVWTIELGWTTITENDNDRTYPLMAGSKERYDYNGKWHNSYANPSLFLTNPFEQQGKEMLVKGDVYDWCVKDVIVTSNGIYVKSGWLEAKEIEPAEVELTLEQIAEKFGCDVNQLKIKK